MKTIRLFRKPLVRYAALALLAFTFVPPCGAQPEEASPRKPIGWGLLFRAARDRQLATAERLVARGQDVNEADEEGTTPLFWAAQKGHADVVVLLLAKGASPEIDGPRGMPLHAAAEEGHREIAELLLAKGADVNAKGENDKTPLHLAAFNGRGEVVELLLAKGAAVDAKDRFGNTPLRWAVAGGDLGIVERLLAKGCDVNAPDVAGVTPLGSLAKENRPELVALLKKHGAR